jgi:hypothetical protein
MDTIIDRTSLAQQSGLSTICAYITVCLLFMVLHKNKHYEISVFTDKKMEIKCVVKVYLKVV